MGGVESVADGEGTGSVPDGDGLGEGGISGRLAWISRFAASKLLVAVWMAAADFVAGSAFSAVCTALTSVCNLERWVAVMRLDSLCRKDCTSAIALLASVVAFSISAWESAHCSVWMGQVPLKTGFSFSSVEGVPVTRLGKILSAPPLMLAYGLPSGMMTPLVVCTEVAGQ